MLGKRRGTTAKLEYAEECTAFSCGKGDPRCLVAHGVPDLDWKVKTGTEGGTEEKMGPKMASSWWKDRW